MALVFLWLTPLAGVLVTLTAASAADQQWVLWGSQGGTRWGTVALFPTEAACRTKGQALVRNVATGSSREKKETKIVDDPIPQSVGIAAIEIRRPDPQRAEKAAADLAAATATHRASLERVLAIHEREVARGNELTELRQDLYSRGILSKREFEDAQRAVVEAQKNVDDTRRAIASADQMKPEAAQAGVAGSGLVQVRLFNAACWPVGVTPQ
jgi:hypothetical protein